MDMQNLKMFLWRLRCICRKELLATIKDPTTRAILVVPVLIQCVIFGYAATYNLERVPYALIDQSHSRESAELLARLDGTGVFYRVATLTGTGQISQVIDGDMAIAVVSIGPDFADKLNRGESAPIQVITDGRNSTTAGVVSGYFSRIVSAYNAQLNDGKELLRLETRAWYNENLITRWNFLPGLMGILSFIQVLMLSGMSVAREREQGTFDQLLVTPLSSKEILIGKAIPPIIIGCIQSTIVLLVCLFWFKIPMAGSLGAIYVTLLLFTTSCVGIGLSISAISSSMQQVMVYCFVLLMPMVLLSGMATPVRNMPEALQILTYADPLRFLLDSLRRIYLEGCGIKDIAWNYVPMAAVAVVTMPLASWLFRHKLT